MVYDKYTKVLAIGLKPTLEGISLLDPKCAPPTINYHSIQFNSIFKQTWKGKKKQ